MNSLEEEFDRTARTRYGTEIYAATGYRPIRMIEMIAAHGALETIQRLMQQYADHASEGYIKLWEHGRLDLSFEALMLEPKFASLFTAEELTWARNRLAEYNYSTSEKE